MSVSPGGALWIARDGDPLFDLATVKTLFREYNDVLGFDLTFQNFERELAELPGKYHPQHNGQLYLAYADDKPAGCVAYYHFSPGVCELKRLFVRPEFHGRRYGKTLLQTAIEDARTAGYRTMVLDSLARLTAARKMYERFGFVDIAPYNENPYDDVYYMSLMLTP